MMTMMGWEWWQAATVTSMAVMVLSSSSSAARLRAALQPAVISQVKKGVPTVLFLQKFQSQRLDTLFGLSSILVSKEFYTAFLPLLFWSGNSKLARQMTLLMAFSIYAGNCLKDTFSAPRPPCPPVRRFTATGSEKDFAMEYGLPSSHTINTICLSGYLLHYMVRNLDIPGIQVTLLVFLFAIISIITIVGRLYLGMHAPIDILAGLSVGALLLAFWSCVDEPLDSFITEGNNVESFWASLSVLMLLAYPTPEAPTPSFEFHTAFVAVAFGVVCGVHRTYHLFHTDNVGKLWIGNYIPTIMLRLIVGYPLIIAVKFLSKELAKTLLPGVCACVGIRHTKSSSYFPLPAVTDPQEILSKDINKRLKEQKSAACHKRSGSWSFLSNDVTFDIDSTVRFIQYAGLGWSVVELVPYCFDFLNI